MVVALVSQLGPCRWKCYPRDGGGIRKIEGAGRLSPGAAAVVLEYYAQIMI